jgi:nuclear transport factor 2 (NTF2) superfamily protein
VTSDQLAKFAERYADAWSSRDPKKVVAFYARDASIRVNDGAPTPIAEVARSFMGDFPDMIVTFDKLELRGDAVAFHWTLIGTYAANGNRLRISGYELWKMDKDGLIAESKGRFDTDDYERQLGG